MCRTVSRPGAVTSQSLCWLPGNHILLFFLCFFFFHFSAAKTNDIKHIKLVSLRGPGRCVLVPLEKASPADPLYFNSLCLAKLTNC